MSSSPSSRVPIATATGVWGATSGRSTWDRSSRLTRTATAWSRAANFSTRVLAQASASRDNTAGSIADLRRGTPAFQAGFDRGLADGRQAGKEDKNINGGKWDLEGQRELEQADAGYESSRGNARRLPGWLPRRLPPRIP